MCNLKMLPGLLVLFCLLSSFGGETKVFKNTNWLPEGFDTRNTVLLVENFSTGLKGNANLKRAEDKVTEDMKAEMQKSYPYKYEFSSAEQISTSSKYANTDVYRYVIIDINGSTPGHFNANATTPRSNSNNPQTYRGQSTGGMSIGTPVNDLYIYDRKIDKSYPPTGHSQGYVVPILRPMINTIVQYLKGLTSPPAALPSSNTH